MPELDDLLDDFEEFGEWPIGGLSNGRSTEPGPYEDGDTVSDADVRLLIGSASARSRQPSSRRKVQREL